LGSGTVYLLTLESINYNLIKEGDPHLPRCKNLADFFPYFDDLGP